MIIEWNHGFARRNLIWRSSRRSEKYKKVHNDGGIYCRGSTRSTTRHPCSRTLKSSTTGSKIESLLSCISRWIGVRDDDRWMQVEISAFSLSFLFRHFPLWKNLYGMTLIEMERRWSLLFEGCFERTFIFVSSLTKKGSVKK